MLQLHVNKSIWQFQSMAKSKVLTYIGTNYIFTLLVYKQNTGVKNAKTWPSKYYKKLKCFLN